MCTLFVVVIMQVRIRHLADDDAEGLVKKIFILQLKLQLQLRFQLRLQPPAAAEAPQPPLQVSVFFVEECVIVLACDTTLCGSACCTSPYIYLL